MQLGNYYRRVNEARESIKVDGRVRISRGNTKMGAIPSVSLLPILDCGHCSECKHKCYDVRHDVTYRTVLASRVINSSIAHHNPASYFGQISDYCHGCKAFRWHVGGDILSASYLCGMVRVAQDNSQCDFLAFTKRYDLVNGYLDDGYDLPSNLHIVLSRWLLPIDNHHNLPTSRPIFRGESIAIGGSNRLCGGNCSRCHLAGEGCFALRAGECVYFPEH